MNSVGSSFDHNLDILPFLALFVDAYAQQYDTETLLTRMLLKGMIEYLSSSVQPSTLEAAMIQLTDVNFEAASQAQKAVATAVATNKA